MKLNGTALKVTSDDRLLGGHMRFTTKNVTWLANQRALGFLETAQRICLCPLSVDARAMLLATAGATKYTFGLELGGCHIHVERRLRTQVLQPYGARDRRNALTLFCHFALKVTTLTQFS